MVRIQNVKDTNFPEVMRIMKIEESKKTDF